MSLRKFYLGRAIGLAVLLLVLALIAAAEHVRNGPVFDDTDNILSTSGDTTCHESYNYLVAARPVPDSVGTDILVKYKTNGGEKVACAYDPESGDFELKNQGAEYFLGLTGRFLLLDSGTAPDPRTLIVYDLDLRKQAYSGMYSKPVVIQNDTVTYWEPAGKATNENCPELAEFEAQGLGAEVEAHVLLDLATLAKRTLGDTRCSARQ